MERTIEVSSGCTTTFAAVATTLPVVLTTRSIGTVLATTTKAAHISAIDQVV